MSAIVAQPTLLEETKANQMQDPFLKRVVDELPKGKRPKFSFLISVVRYIKRMCVLNIEAIKRNILEEAHSTRYSIHSESTKMYYDLKEIYWWSGMKRKIDDFASKYMTCQKVNTEH